MKTKRYEELGREKKRKEDEKKMILYKKKEISISFIIIYIIKKYIPGRREGITIKKKKLNEEGSHIPLY